MTTVLVAIPCLKIGGTEIQTLRLVEALVRDGYRVVTVCYFEYTTHMVQRFQSAGSHVVCLSVYGTRPAGAKAQWRFLKDGLRRVVREYHPDIAHVQYMAPGAMPILILRRLGVKTILATSHTMSDIYKKLYLLHFIQRRTLRAFTCITQTAEKSYFDTSQLYTEDTQLKRHNHFTIYNTLPPNYQITKRPSCNHPLTIGFVGRLTGIKGADIVIPAFAQFKQTHPDAKLNIVGDGALKEQMLQQQAELHLENSIVWTGEQHHERLPQIYQQMDIVWIPSRSEGFGLTAIEAMANGCVVIASHTGGLPEIINNDNLLFTPDDISDLLQKTNNCIPMLHALSEALTKRAEDFQFDSYQSLITNLYHKL